MSRGCRNPGGSTNGPSFRTSRRRHSDRMLYIDALRCGVATETGRLISTPAAQFRQHGRALYRRMGLTVSFLDDALVLGLDLGNDVVHLLMGFGEHFLG